MAPAITHFLVGASILLLVATPVALRCRLSPWIPLWLVSFGGLWGLGPDIHHIAPVYETELRAFHDSAWADLFAFHHTLDRPAVRAEYNASVFGSIVLFFGSVMAFTMAAKLRTRTHFAETTALHFVALSIALLPLLLLVATAGGWFNPLSVSV